MKRVDLTNTNMIDDFAVSGRLSDEDRERLRNKAVHYQGVSPDSVDEMITNAENLIDEVQAGFKRTINDQVERAVLIIESSVGPESMAQENRDTLYNLIGIINAENPDLGRANEVVDEMAIKLSTIFNQVKIQAEQAEDDFDDRFNKLEDRFGPDPFDGFGDQPSNEEDFWPDY